MNQLFGVLSYLAMEPEEDQEDPQDTVSPVERMLERAIRERDQVPSDLPEISIPPHPSSRVDKRTTLSEEDKRERSSLGGKARLAKYHHSTIKAQGRQGARTRARKRDLRRHGAGLLQRQIAGELARITRLTTPQKKRF